MAAAQRVSANAIAALKEALTAAFWYKPDLYAYARAAVRGEPEFVTGIGWTDPETYKRDSVDRFVDRLVRAQDRHQDLLLALMVDVASMEDFPGLKRTEDAEKKVAAAHEAVNRLRRLIQPYEQALAEQQAARDRIRAARDVYAQRRATNARLAELRSAYVKLLSMPPQQRGFALESFLRQVFECFDLDPRASFRTAGEQIDGGFSLDGEHFLLEVKWENRPCDRAALDSFAMKVQRRAENTLGLVLAISGFEPTAVEAHCTRGSAMILADGADLYAVLDQRIDLRELLRRKRRHAAMTGHILLSANDLLAAS